jgi:hypothetical protein
MISAAWSPEVLHGSFRVLQPSLLQSYALSLACQYGLVTYVPPLVPIRYSSRWMNLCYNNNYDIKHFLLVYLHLKGLEGNITVGGTIILIILETSLYDINIVLVCSKDCVSCSTRQYCLFPFGLPLYVFQANVDCHFSVQKPPGLILGKGVGIINLLTNMLQAI